MENQIQTVGNNVKQFCSEFIEDVLPPSSGKDTDLKVHENLKERTDENPEEELCKENLKGGLTVEYHIGTVGNNLKQLRLQFREDSIEGTDENPKQGLYDEDSNEDLRETTIKNSKKGATESPADKQSQSTISEIGAISDDNSSMTSGVHFITREDSNSVEESCIVNDLNQSCELKVSSHGPSSPFGDNCSEESNGNIFRDKHYLKTHICYVIIVFIKLVCNRAIYLLQSLISIASRVSHMALNIHLTTQSIGVNFIYL